jgi:hypothetical protein
VLCSLVQSAKRKAKGRVKRDRLDDHSCVRNVLLKAANTAFNYNREYANTNGIFAMAEGSDLAN